MGCGIKDIGNSALLCLSNKLVEASKNQASIVNALPLLDEVKGRTLYGHTALFYSVMGMTI